MTEYNFLRGKVVEKLGSLTNYAKALGITKTALSLKMTSQNDFTTQQIRKSIEILELSPEEVFKCFFSWVQTWKNFQFKIKKGGNLVRKGNC